MGPEQHHYAFAEAAASYFLDSPLAAMLARRVAIDDLYEDDRVFAFFASHGRPIATARDARKLLTATQFRLRQRQGRDEFALYFPVLGGRLPPDERAYQLFREFLRDHRSQIVQAMAREPMVSPPDTGRQALSVVTEYLAELEDSRDLALLNIGAAAGYELVSDQVGEPALLAGHQVRVRAGVDLAPLSVADPTTLQWLMSSVLPEAIEHQSQIRVAVSLLERNGIAVTRGDAVTFARSWMLELSCLPVIFGHSVLCALDKPIDLHAAIAARPGETLWVLSEQAATVAAISNDSRLQELPPDQRVVLLRHYRDGHIIGSLLAKAWMVHGYLAVLGPESAPGSP